MTKQTIEHRLARLNNRSCPVHGISMGQVGVNTSNGRYVVECCRGDCGIQAEDCGKNNPFQLTEAFMYLIN
ncbi:hypothetical protein LMH73_023395 [Vibrio splendidus]|nr:hypothetical protein [Vibrio splendidus]MCC4882515.1 hypothetical protein [Vibrio splendidus]